MAATETRRLISARCSFMASTPKPLYTRVAERSPILHFPHLLCVIAFDSIDSDQFAARRSVGDCHPHCDQCACHIAKPRDYFAGTFCLLAFGQRPCPRDDPADLGPLIQGQCVIAMSGRIADRRFQWAGMCGAVG